jgi:hypothetical protein
MAAGGGLYEKLVSPSPVEKRNPRKHCIVPIPPLSLKPNQCFSKNSVSRWCTCIKKAGTFALE